MTSGKPAQSLILVGLRGVGKTVLLNKISDLAVENGCRVAFVEAHEGKSLPELLAPSIRSMLHALSVTEGAKDLARRGLRALKGFLNGLRVNIQDVEFSMSMDSEHGLADSGDLEADLPDLITALGEAAAAAGRPIAFLIDELQYLSEQEFSALIMAIHKTTQKRLPVILVGAGLPQIRALAGNSKSYCERLFRFPEIGALDEAEAAEAIQKPALAEGVQFTASAIGLIMQRTERYPYFLQQWAYESWNLASSEIISINVVENATPLALKELDQSFFKVRFERCNPSERRYMRALAELGPGKHRSGDVGECLGLNVRSIAPTRSSLIRKGMIYSPSHGDTAFTVPLFDQYMRRTIRDFKRSALLGIS